MDKFAESLAKGFEKQNRMFEDTLSPEYSAIKKVAGMTIFQPTAENIESFVKKYIREELKQFPKTVGVFISIIPDTVSGTNEKYIKDARGEAVLTLHNVKIKIPFMIDDGELVPFDVIQLKDKMVPYNKENLIKILTGIDKIVTTNPEILNGESGFLGTEKPITELSDFGFLKDVLEIRDSHVNSGAPLTNGGHYIYASNAFDAILEKTAKVKEITEDDFKKIEKMLLNKVASSYKDYMEKIANENIDNEINDARIVLGKIADMKWRNIYDMKSGQHIVFPEKDGNDISMTKAIVFHGLDVCREYDWFGVKNFRSNNSIGAYEKKELKRAEKKENSSLIVTIDGRFLILQNKQPFYAIETNDNWKLKTVNIEAAKFGKVYTAIADNRVIYPFVVKTEDPYFRSKDIENDVSAPKAFTIHCEEWPFGYGFKIVEVPDAKFDVMNQADALEVYASKTANVDILAKIKAMMPSGIFWGCDAKTRIIPLSGSIKDYLKNPKQLEFTQGDKLFKEASANYVKLDCYDAERGIFDLEIQWKDKNSKIPKTIRKGFYKIRRSKVVGILRAANIPSADVAQLIAKAERDNRAVMDLPPNATPDQIRGGEMIQRKVSKMMGVLKDKILNDKNLEAIGTSIIGTQVADLIDGVDRASDIIEALKKWANESEVCAIHFEKYAQENKSKSALNIAKAMVACYNTANILKQAFEEGKQFNFFKEAMQTVVDNQTEIEKMAYDLIKTKAMQYKLDTERISPNILKAAVDCLDKLVKVANSTTHSNLVCEVCGAKAGKDFTLIDGKCPACAQAEIEKNKADTSADDIQDDSEIVSVLSESGM